MAERLKEATQVGRGFTSNVYAWGPGRVLKLYHEWVPHERAESEYMATRAVNAIGLPAPMAYEVVAIDSRVGIIFERVDGISMLAHFQRTPWRMFAALRQLAELQAQMHAKSAPPNLPSQRERLANGIAKSESLSAAQKAAAQAALAELPDGTAVCHGDFHPENVLFTTKGPVVIDWSSASRGHPLGDVACTARLIQIANLPSWTPGYMHLILKCSRVLLRRSYTRRLLRHYRATREEMQKWKRH